MGTRIESTKRIIAATAVLPWNSVDALAKITVPIVDSPEDIEICLNCEFPKCWNCLAEKRARF